MTLRNSQPNETCSPPSAAYLCKKASPHHRSHQFATKMPKKRIMSYREFTCQTSLKEFFFVSITVFLHKKTLKLPPKKKIMQIFDYAKQTQNWLVSLTEKFLHQSFCFLFWATTLYSVFTMQITTDWSTHFLSQQARKWHPWAFGFFFFWTF